MAAALLALAAAPAHAQPCGTRTGGAPTLTAGQTVRGALAREDFTLPGDRYDGRDACTGRPYDSFFYEAQAGERLTFVLESRQIDPSVTATTHWRGGGTKDVVEQRGRRGRTLTATGVVPATGRILIQVASNVSLGRRGSTGDYTFTLRSDRPAGGPASPEPSAPGGSALRPGQPVSGELVTADGQLADDSYFDDYAYEMRRGDRITVTLRSEDFDAYLHVGRRVADGTLENLQTDDDGAGGTDARVEYTADQDGPVTIRVNTLGEGETGRYTLDLEAGGASPAPPADENASADGNAGPTAGLTALRLGRPVQGELAEGDGLVDDGSFHDDYTYRARRGERLVIRLESGDFDAVLAVTGVGADGQPENPVVDDDGGGGTNARVEYTAQRDGPLLIRANTLAAGETGRYTLVVQAADRGAAAPAPASSTTERMADRAADRPASNRTAADGGRTGIAGALASTSLAFAGAPRSFRADPLAAQAAHPLRAPALAPRRADPVLSRRATAWLMAGVGVGMILAGAAIEDTPAEPLGALIRYTGYALVVFAPISGGG
jgi:hypothetical protein